MIKKGEKTDAMVWLNLRIILFVSVPVAFSAWYFGRDIIFLLYHQVVNSPGELMISQKSFFPVTAAISNFYPLLMIQEKVSRRQNR